MYCNLAMCVEIDTDPTLKVQLTRHVTCERDTVGFIVTILRFININNLTRLPSFPELIIFPFTN